MPMKSPGRKTYTSMQGKQIDMDMLRKKNELTPAVGNARVNARGDVLGKGGKIIKKNEDSAEAYYKGPEKTKSNASAQKPSAQPAEQASARQHEVDEWMEDEDGNFIKKGE